MVFLSFDNISFRFLDIILSLCIRYWQPSIRPSIRFIYCINSDCFLEDEMDNWMCTALTHSLNKNDVIVSRFFFSVFFFSRCVRIGHNFLEMSSLPWFTIRVIRYFNITFAYQYLRFLSRLCLCCQMIRDWHFSIQIIMNFPSHTHTDTHAIDNWHSLPFNMISVGY